MKTLAERLKYAMEVLPPKKIKGVELARAVGVKPPSVSDWLSGKSKNMDGPNLVRAAKFLKVNSTWLGTGVGQPTDKEKEFSQNFDFTHLELIKIPVLDYVQAGMWKDISFDGVTPLSFTYTNYDGADPKEIFSIVVRGDSMEPDFKEGDKLIIDSSLQPKPGCFVVAKNGSNDATFKKYKVTGYDEFSRDEFELVPLNDNYPRLSSKDHQITIIGVMVRHMRDYKY